MFGANYFGEPYLAQGYAGTKTTTLPLGWLKPATPSPNPPHYTKPKIEMV